MELYRVIPGGADPADHTEAAYQHQAVDAKAAVAVAAQADIRDFGTAEASYDVYRMSGRTPVLEAQGQVPPTTFDTATVSLDKQEEIEAMAKKLVLMVKAYQEQPQKLEAAFVQILTPIVGAKPVEGPAKGCACGKGGCTDEH